MDYVKDWDKSKKRYEAFYQNEIIDRCLCSIKTMSDKYVPSPTPDIKDQKAMEFVWTDPETKFHRQKNFMENTLYYGDAFPFVDLAAGPSAHAALFKGVKCMYESTVWFYPVMNDISDEIVFDENSPQYQNVLDCSRYAAEQSKGRFCISCADASGNLDALAHLRSSEELLVDLLCEDEDVITAQLNKIQKVYEKLQGDLFDIVLENNDGGGVIGWLDVWGPGKTSQLQSDISVMISNDLFKKFVMPELLRQSEFLDHCVYHFDGQEQIMHLDDLLSIPRLNAIQWTGVTGQPPPSHFIPELQKIQAAGKGLVINTSADQIEPLMTNLSSKGLFLKIYVGSKDEAEYAFKLIEKLTRE